MTYIDDLIKEHCPNGVEWKELWEVAKLKNGKDWKTLSKGEIPVYGSGGNMGEFVSKQAYDKPTVLIPRKGSISNLFYLEQPFWNVDTIYYTEIDESQMLPKYFYYYLTTVNLESMATNPTRPSLTQSILDKIKIPLPPLSIQEEIVKILDKFSEYVTELTAELTAELTLRQKQYSFYRDKLLSFEGEVYQVEWKTLGEVAKLKNGKDWKTLSKGGVPVYGSGGSMGEFVSEQSYDKPTVLIPRKGSISNLFYLEHPFWNVDTIYYTEIDEGQIIPKYFYYYLTTVDLESMATNPTRPSLTQSILDKIKIPVPSLSIQSRIVQVLDNFDTVCNDLNIGLPKEIKQRQKQYEFIRDKLLTFTAEGVYAKSRVEEWDAIAIKILQWVFGPIRVELGAVFTITAGGDVPKDALSEYKTEEFPVQILSNGVGDKSIYGWTSSAKITEPSLTVSARGTIGWTSYRTDPFYPIVRLLTLTPSIELDLRYTYHFMKSIENQYEIPKSGIPQLTRPMISHTIIILPPLSTQSYIVSILDKFDELTTSISMGLPKEIELRQKEYEYFRDKLLRF